VVIPLIHGIHAVFLVTPKIPSYEKDHCAHRLFGKLQSRNPFRHSACITNKQYTSFLLLYGTAQADEVDRRPIQKVRGQSA
jgi:hypothetical protein